MVIFLFFATKLLHEIVMLINGEIQKWKKEHIVI